MIEAKLSSREQGEIYRILRDAESRTHDIIIIMAAMIVFIVLSVAVYIAQTVITSLREKRHKKKTTMVISMNVAEKKTARKEKKGKKKEKNNLEEEPAETAECFHGPVIHEPSKTISFLIDLVASLPLKPEEPRSQQQQSNSQVSSHFEPSLNPVTTPLLPTPTPTSIRGIRKITSQNCPSPAEQKKKTVSWLDETTAVEVKP